jgi:energy-coupling factor transporter ATP-binding protein EcfA2
VADHRLEGLAGLVDRVIVLLEGRVVMDGSPEEVVPREDLERMGVEVPAVVRLWKRLRERGLYRGPCPMTVEELARRIEQIWSRDHG